MTFFDEKIARLQKLSKMKNDEADINQEKDTIKESYCCNLSQDEVNRAIHNGKLSYNGMILEFENNKFFDERINVPMIKEFFDESGENDWGYFWCKKNSIAITLNKMELENRMSIESSKDLVEKLHDVYKSKRIYIEFLEHWKEEYDKYARYVINSRLPTAVGYTNQYFYFIEMEDMAIIILFEVLESKKEIWEKVIKGIADSIKINMGDK